jgi:hypothetical protein
LIPDILPLNLIESFELFKACFKVDAYGSKFSPILHFVKMYRLSWIIKWQYVIVGDRLERHWFIKWWDKFAVDIIINKVKLLIQAPRAQSVPLPSIVSPKLLTPEEIGKTPDKALSAVAASPIYHKEGEEKSFIESYD